MASQAAAVGQGMHADLRRTVDRVGERYDERSLPPIRDRPDGLMKPTGLFAIEPGFIRIGG
jgi:hypothetical protein